MLMQAARRRACRTSCVATARTCGRHLPGSPLISTKTLLRVGAWNALRTSTSATTFLPRSPVAISDCSFSASSGGVDAYNSGLAFVLYSFATHLARTFGFPGCSLSVSAHPVLMGAHSVSRRHASLGDPRVHHVATDVLHFFTSCLGAQFPDQATCLCCHANVIFPTR